MHLTVTSTEAKKRKNELRGRCFRFNAVTLYHDCCKQGCVGYEPEIRMKNIHQNI